VQDQQAELEWRDGLVPVSTRFDDPYFSLEDGLAETQHVFLAGNDLPHRFCDGFHVAELGFGTGLNFLTTWAAWRAADVPGTLKFTSFEAYPMALSDMGAALDAFPAVRDLAVQMIEKMHTGGNTFAFEGAVLTVVPGDARVTLPDWAGTVDAWFLDGFSPAKNPELWGAELMKQVAAHTKPQGTAATYTAAGFVRRGLEEAGFTVDRIPGYGRKRQMTRAVLG